MSKKGEWLKYLPGEKIGPYQTLVLSREPGTNKGTFKCSFCGKEFSAIVYNVAKGNTTSCGCIFSKVHREHFIRLGKAHKKDLKGKRFGKLLVVEETNKRADRKIVWKCKCDCGNVAYVTGRSLLGGNTQSCGKCNCSHGEQKIKEILEDGEINFIQEYKFNDCVNPKTNQKLRFDFYLPDYNCCIEYDGIQHFKEKGTWARKESLKDIQYRDEIKNRYCKKHNIKLIRIPYYHKEEITYDYLLERLKK